MTITLEGCVMTGADSPVRRGADHPYLHYRSQSRLDYIAVHYGGSVRAAVQPIGDAL
jgi:hypothetical protein